ncbi:MAG: Membrane lipoprotein TmpC precursor [Tenericutes bacterium ADurb.Bin239]|nr:MAG: Membrane lipoprotein TmpC precursor [Tenericutes bacterium ADurb.Bin239]
MKKSKLFKVGLILISMLIVGCSGNGGATSNGSQTGSAVDDGKTKIALLINGNLGDMSFFDSAAAGMEKFKADHPEVVVDIVEIGTDNTRWEPTLRLTANDDYDLIIVGTTDMREPLQRLVKNSKYNDKRFILFDTEIEDNNAHKYPTVRSVLFKQNEGGYLAGVLAALMTREAGKTNTAFIGGMKIDIINDFGYGFMQGIKKVNADFGANILAYNSYIGDFFNSTKGKTLADTMYREGNVDVLFAAASQAGLGCLDSAKNNNKYFIGVDSDQYEYFKPVDSVKADKIVTSVLKRVDLMLYEACEQFLAGELEYGVLQYEGLKEGKVGIVQNENYENYVSAANREYIDQIISDIISGELVVNSGLRRFTSTEDLNAYYDSLDPNKQ